MSDHSVLSVKILGKDYQVGCPTGREQSLLEAAHCLDQTMANIRRSGRVIGLERIAVMAALNLANDLLQQQAQSKELNLELEQKLVRLQDKIDRVISKRSQRSVEAEALEY